VPFPTLASRELTAATGARRQARPDIRRMLRAHWVSAALTLIIVCGALARLLGGSWGLPLELHPDEWVIIDGALDMAKRNSFEPPYFFRPDHVEMQLSYVAYVTYAHFFDASSVGNAYASGASPFILISRTITACFGIAMIVVGYLIGKRFNRVIGVLAAFVMAFFPMYVDHSHFATPDVPLTLTLMIVILGCMRYLDSPSWGNLLLASIGVSISIAIKYPGVLGTIMIAITVITSAVQTRAWSRILAHGVVAIAAVVGFLFAISPSLFTKFQLVGSTIDAEGGTIHAGADGLGWFGNLGFYAATFASTAGIILLVCFALGVLWSVRLRLTQSIPLWLGAIYWVILSGVPLHWARWGLPMYLTPLLIAPIGVYYSFRYLLDNGAARWVRWSAVGLGAVMTANLMLGSVAATAVYLTRDTRTTAKEYFAEHGINKTNSVYEGYTPFAPRSARSIYGQLRVSHNRLVLRRAPGNYRFHYVILSSLMYDRYKSGPKYAGRQKMYATMDKQLPLLTTFDPATRASSVLEITSIWNALGFLGHVARGANVGPTIKLYGFPGPVK
jgi:4-amino-4-deoxy-L-arabinose transferase-like glycosyltransferase